MSDERQQAAIGRLVEEYLASKKKLVALQGEGQKVASTLAQLADVFRSASGLGGNVYLTSLNQLVANLPTGSSILSLVNDTRATAETKIELYSQLKSMGMEPRD